MEDGFDGDFLADTPVEEKKLIHLKNTNKSLEKINKRLVIGIFLNGILLLVVILLYLLCQMPK